MSLQDRISRVRRREWEAERKRHEAKPGGERRSKLAKLVRSLRALKERLLRRLHDPRVVLTSGAPHWGGCEDILANEVVPVLRGAGVTVTSGKRSETYGNPTSDHHTSQLTASARDAATVNNFALRDRVMHALGVEGAILDYHSYYIVRSGARFRVQPIAGTHGTGPHLHIGIRRA